MDSTLKVIYLSFEDYKFHNFRLTFQLDYVLVDVRGDYIFIAIIELATLWIGWSC